MYEGAVTVVKLRGGKTKQLEMKVGGHQESALNPLLFTIVPEALSCEFNYLHVGHYVRKLLFAYQPLFEAQYKT